jgi:pimeloyl-ACP methyl ester carboxylesterase
MDQRANAAALTRSVEVLQDAYLERCAPASRTYPVKWSGGTTQVIEIGQGPPLVLVHGGLGEAFHWGPLLVPLARHHRVLAIDRPGHGLADPFNYRRVDVLKHACTFLGEVLDAMQLQTVALAGNSMGGRWAAEFAMLYPRRVKHLLLIGAPAGMKRQIPTSMRLAALPGIKQLVRAQMRRPNRQGMRSFWGSLLVAHPERLDEGFIDLLVASQKRNCATWFGLLDRAVDFRGMKLEFLLGDRWVSLTVPTTFIWGEKDVFGSPEEGETVARIHPRIRAVRIEDAGHAPWFDQPEKVASAIESALGTG